MGMVGQLYVRPRQNRVAPGASLVHGAANSKTTCDQVRHRHPVLDPVPPRMRSACRNRQLRLQRRRRLTHYDVEYPIQIHGFDPNFHFVGMTLIRAFTDMKDKYFLLERPQLPRHRGQGNHDDAAVDGTLHASQPVPTIINIPFNGRALRASRPGRHRVPDAGVVACR